MALPAAELIQRMADGDRSAFAEFYDRFAALVYPLVLRIVREPADVADVMQEVFWEAWQLAGTYDPRRGSPEAWIITRARSRAIDRVRAVRRRGETFVAPVEEAMAPDPAPDAAARAESRGAVQSALARLSAGQREVIELAYYGGLTQSENAERLKQPPRTVKTRVP